MILDIFLIILSVFLLLSCVFWAYLFVYVLYYKVPLISTSKVVVEAMVDLAEIKGNQKIYELGCGFAPMLFLASTKYPNNQYFGYEVLRPIVWFNHLKAKILKRNVLFKKTNFFTEDLSEADIVFAYLWDSIMSDFYTKKWRNLKKGCVVISHGFPIKDLESKLTKKVGKSIIYVYRKI